MSDYLGSLTAANIVESILEQDANSERDHIQQLPPGMKIKVRTAQSWLKKLDLHYHTVSKNVYIDGHEREDVVEYCQKDFLPTWANLEKRMVIFSEDGL